jgi:site-specific DNA-methyltransferase (adenine-specific)
MPEAYYSVPNFRLYLGNCLELLKAMPVDCVDMVFADPPYYLSNGGFTVQSGRAVSVNKGEWDKSQGYEKDLESYSEWIKEVKRVLKPHGTIWISGTYHSIYLCGYALIREGYKILNDIAWSKPNAAPNLSGRYFAASHETLLWARKDAKARHTFNYELMRSGHWPEDKFKVPNKQMKSVWSLNTPMFKEKLHGKHPTQKPLQLLERIVLASTNEGDLVLDPFTGSSTTGLAAHKWGRKFVGIDTEREYLDLSIKRHKDLLKETAGK